MLPILVCAATQEEAQAWARSRGVHRSQMIYTSSPRVVVGMRDFAVVRLPGFFGREDRDAIEAEIHRSERRSR